MEKERIFSKENILGKNPHGKIYFSKTLFTIARKRKEHSLRLFLKKQIREKNTLLKAEI
jgi:hypothetical protein